MAYDLTGQRFGRLLVLKKSDENIQKKSKLIIWHCICDCGNEVDIRSQDLRSGKIQSCGCLHKDIISTHGLSRNRLYQIWIDMRSRCNNTNLKCYYNYGGRGIKVCEEWDNYQSFYNWSMNNGYMDELTIDRIDVNGNYEPNNCKWSTKLEQENNRRNNRFSYYNSEKMTISDFKRITGISRNFITNNLNKNKTFDEIKREYDEIISNCSIPSKYSSLELSNILNDRHSDTLSKLKRLKTSMPDFDKYIIEKHYKTKCNNISKYYEIDKHVFNNILVILKERKVKK